ncbi:MAG: glycosyl hydrolase family 18 protein [Desulfosporosinus sp.]|nr:glycosyl hydrolase family 18 protein [Desulfosporosinus sp.]
MPLNVFAFYNGLTEQTKGYPYLKRYGNSIQELAIFEVSIQSNGAILGRPSRKLIEEAHTMGIKVYLVISNLTRQGQFSTALMGRLVREQEFANLVWRNIRNVLVEYRMDGVNLDLEKAAPADRPLFSQLIQTWSAMFKEANLVVSIDVPAKTSSDPLNAWRGRLIIDQLGELSMR